MYLKELIEFLEGHDPAISVPLGFGNPHSYRGVYAELAFEPVENTTVGTMLQAARSAKGQMYYGYKGGEYLMDDWTPVHLARYGETGEDIGPALLRFMLGAPAVDVETAAEARKWSAEAHKNAVKWQQERDDYCAALRVANTELAQARADLATVRTLLADAERRAYRHEHMPHLHEA